MRKPVSGLKSNVSSRPRICVVDNRDAGRAYERLGDCRVNVMEVLPSLTQLRPPIASAYDAVLVGCTERMLMSPAFRARIQRLARDARLIAVLASPPPNAGAQAASLGFAGLVAREVSPRALERTIAAVARGGSAYPRSALKALVELIVRLSARRLLSPTEASLTPRQEQVVELIAQGATDREIAKLLRISESTAHKHVQNALRRLKARTRSQLVATAGHHLISAQMFGR